jgi:hypothetical protein
VPLALPNATAAPRRQGQARAPNRFYMYGVIARLAMLAASYELEATDPELLDAASTARRRDRRTPNAPSVLPSMAESKTSLPT